MDLSLVVTESLGSIFTLAEAEFSSAPANTTLPAESRARLTARVRDESNHLRVAFSRARAALDALPRIVRLTRAQVRAGVARDTEELSRLLRAVDALPPVRGAAAWARPSAATPSVVGGAAEAYAPSAADDDGDDDSDTPPYVSAVFTLEAFRGALFETLASLEAAAAGRADLGAIAGLHKSAEDRGTSSGVAAALDALLERALRGEEPLTASYTACSAACAFEAAVCAPLAATIADVRAEAAARADAAANAARNLEAALAAARSAVSALEAAKRRPVALEHVLALAANLAVVEGPPPPGWVPGAPLPPYTLPPCPTPQELMATLHAAVDVALDEVTRVRAVNAPARSRAPPWTSPDGQLVVDVEAFVQERLRGGAAEVAGADEPMTGGGEGTGVGTAGGAGAAEGAGAADGSVGVDADARVTVGGGAAAGREVQASVAAPASGFSTATFMKAVAALTAAERAQLKALLPPGWAPGLPLPPGLPDIHTLLLSVSKKT